MGARDLPPSRGATILVVGILSFVLCHFLGPVAWAMGNDDLREIDAGRLSDDGRGLVTAGRALGIVSTCLVVLAVVVVLFLVVATPSHR
jgi:hypothetical protein